MARARRRPSLKKTVAAVVRASNRRKAQWAVLWNTPCATQLATVLEDCPNGGRLALMNQATLRSDDVGDAMRIHRLQGNIYFLPTTLLGASPPTPDSIATANGEMNCYMRAGLLKSETTQRNGGIPEAVDPLSGEFVPFNDFSDWTEQSWMRVWEHIWPPSGQISSGASGMTGCCSVVTGGASAIENGITWTITEGAIDTSIETECTPCGEGTAPTNNFTAPMVRYPWHLHFDIKRTILLKENDSLDLWFGWENLRGFFDTGRREQPEMVMWGGVRGLIET